MSEPEFNSLRSLVAKEQLLCDQLIQSSVASRVELIQKMGEYIITSGGKRLRPLLVLLSTKAFGYQDKQSQADIKLAATIELLHTATLLHDDVVDHSELRRGKSTANKVWGDNAAVLVGDYLYSRAFQLMVEVGQMKVLDIMAYASNRMAEGEVLQLLNAHDPDISEENYMRVIYHKTGTLFAAAAQMGPILMNQSQEVVEIMLEYGNFLGSAFQLVDDALDYSASCEQMGKNMGDDLREGKPTLPLIRAIAQLKESNHEKAELLKNALKTGESNNIDNLISIIQSTDAISYTYEAARREAKMARNYLEKIPTSEYREALMQLIDFAIARYY